MAISSLGRSGPGLAHSYSRGPNDLGVDWAMGDRSRGGGHSSERRNRNFVRWPASPVHSGRRAEVRRTDSRTHKMLRASLLVALLSPSAAFHLGQHVALRPPAPRLSPVVAAAEKHATVIFLRHGQTLPPSFEAEP